MNQVRTDPLTANISDKQIELIDAMVGLNLEHGFSYYEGHGQFIRNELSCQKANLNYVLLEDLREKGVYDRRCPSELTFQNNPYYQYFLTGHGLKIAKYSYDQRAKFYYLKKQNVRYGSYSDRHVHFMSDMDLSDRTK